MMGIDVIGFADALVLTPALPTIIEAALEKVNDQRKKLDIHELS
jgi:hypothetical protein